MNLISVDEAAELASKTPSMIYYLANQKVLTKYPVSDKAYGAPTYLVDADEVLRYYETKEPRTDYSTFLDTMTVTVDGEDYVSITAASKILNQTDSRIRYMTQKYEVRSTKVVKPKKGLYSHDFYCLRELSEINETVSKIIELRSFIDAKRRK